MVCIVYFEKYLDLRKYIIQNNFEVKLDFKEKSMFYSSYKVHGLF